LAILIGDFIVHGFTFEVKQVSPGSSYPDNNLIQTTSKLPQPGLFINQGLFFQPRETLKVLKGKKQHRQKELGDLIQIFAKMHYFYK
jgi:hypothetical protein